MKYVFGFLAVFAINLLIAFVVYIWFPDYIHYLETEDSLIENLSAGFFLFSSILALSFFIKRKSHQKLLILISSLGFLGFLEELSFGERIFKFSAPHLGGVKIDTVHDLLSLQHKLWGYDLLYKLRHYHTPYIYILAVICVLGLLLISRYRSQLMNAISVILRHPPYILMSFFIALLFFASLFDLHIWHSKALDMVEELLEMNAAIVLLFCCLSLSKTSLNPSGVPLISN